MLLTCSWFPFISRAQVWIVSHKTHPARYSMHFKLFVSQDLHGWKGGPGIHHNDSVEWSLSLMHLCTDYKHIQTCVQSGLE